MTDTPITSALGYAVTWTQKLVGEDKPYRAVEWFTDFDLAAEARDSLLRSNETAGREYYKDIQLVASFCRARARVGILEKVAA